MDALWRAMRKLGQFFVSILDTQKIDKYKYLYTYVGAFF